MKQWLACIALVFSCFSPVAPAQETTNKTLAKFSFGMDFSVQPGGFSRDYDYTNPSSNNSNLDASGTDYLGGNALGGTVQFNEGNGWAIEGRTRRQSIGNPSDWVQFQNQPVVYESDISSNAVQQFGGSYSATDIIQQIPLLRHKIQRYGFSVNVVAGATNVRSVIQIATTVFPPNPVYDIGTTTYNFLGPKGGGKAGYTNKWFNVTSELTIGCLHEHGIYNDIQGQYENSTIVYSSPYVTESTIWSREISSRSSLTVPVRSRVALKPTYEKRVDSNPNGYFVFGVYESNGVKLSESLDSRATMIGFVFHL